MLAEQIIDDQLPDRRYRLLSNPIAANLIGPERLGGHPVCVQAARLHSPEPAGFNDMDPVRRALAEESLAVLSRGGRYRPDAPARAIAREPEHWRVTRIDCPYQRLRVWTRSEDTRPEHVKRGVLAKVPQVEGTFPLIRRRSPASQQILRVVRIHHRQSPMAGCTELMPARGNYLLKLIAAQGDA